MVAPDSGSFQADCAAHIACLPKLAQAFIDRPLLQDLQDLRFKHHPAGQQASPAMLPDIVCRFWCHTARQRTLCGVPTAPPGGSVHGPKNLTACAGDACVWPLLLVLVVGGAAGAWRQAAACDRPQERAGGVPTVGSGRQAAAAASTASTGRYGAVDAAIKRQEGSVARALVLHIHLSPGACVQSRVPPGHNQSSRYPA